jgi:hypothetical protein
VTNHAGGYTPFFADVTDWLTAAGPQQVIVRAFDDPHDLTQPRGSRTGCSSRPIGPPTLRSRLTDASAS